MKPSRKSAVVDRDHEAVRTSGGVYVNPTHWASRSVHAFRRWTGPTTVVVWCGLTVDLSQAARLTSDLISCLQCSESSWQDVQRRIDRH